MAGPFPCWCRISVPLVTFFPQPQAQRRLRPDSVMKGEKWCYKTNVACGAYIYFATRDLVAKEFQGKACDSIVGIIVVDNLPMSYFVLGNTVDIHY